MVNNDRKNELTRMITKMATDEKKKGHVVGMYLNAFQEDDEKKIEIVSVIDEMTKEWEELKKGHSTVMACVHHIKIFPSVVHASEFSRVYLGYQEALLAQQLKNAYIIYDGKSEWGQEEHFLEELRESYLDDKYLTFYRNRLEISPKLIQMIHRNLRTGSKAFLFSDRTEEVHLSKAEASHLVDKKQLTVDKKLQQVRDLLLRYRIELEKGLPQCDLQTSSFITGQYIACNDENLKLFQKLQAKTTAFNYKLDDIFKQMRLFKEDQFTEEEKTEFFSRCLSYLERGFEHINPIDYLMVEEQASYQKLKSMGERK